MQKNTEVYKIIKTAGKIYISTASLVWAEPHVFCHLLTERYGLATPCYCTSDSDKAHSAREIRTIPFIFSIPYWPDLDLSNLYLLQVKFMRLLRFWQILQYSVMRRYIYITVSDMVSFDMVCT